MLLDMFRKFLSGQPEIVNESGEFSLCGMQMEIDDTGKQTGGFRVKRSGARIKPRGTWPDHWIDPVHELTDMEWVARVAIGRVSNCSSSN